MKKNRILALILTAMLCLSIFSGCIGGKNSVTVTFLDGDSVLSEQKVKSGQCATEPDGVSKEGYIFMGWYATPSYSRAFDFSAPVTEDISIWAGYAEHEVDTREYYLLGNGTSPLLFESSWGTVVTDAHKMSKSDVETENIYTITVDLAAGDEFVFGTPGWGYKHGAGYIVNPVIDGVECFAVGEKLSNTVVLESGNYTFTMYTFPKYLTAGDMDESEAYYIYNVYSNFDYIEVTRNGDMLQGDMEFSTEYYIKGSGVTNWQDIYNNVTRMENTDDSYSMSIYLTAGEQFLFTSANSYNGQISAGTDYVKYENLDDASVDLFNEVSGNMEVINSGLYTFTYSSSTLTLSATFEQTEPVKADYYLDGTFGDEEDWSGYCFNKSYQLNNTEDSPETYTITGVHMKAGSQLVIQSFTEGAKERGEWGTESYTGIDCLQYGNLYDPEGLFSPVDDSNNNILVTTEGDYDISLDAYTQMITITKAQ